jgi:hypothetical protein
MSDDDAADKAFAALKEIFSQPLPMKSYRTYDLKFVDGEPVFTLSEFDRIFEEILESWEDEKTN